MNRIFNQQLKINKYLIVGIFLLTPILSVQKITAGVLYIDQMLTSGKIGNECVSYFPVKINSEGANTNSADIKINFDPTKAQLHDFDSNKPGIQVQNGNVYVELPYNISDNTLGEIKVTGYRLNSFNGDNVFFYVYFKPLQFNTPIDFEIELTDVGNTYDSNIAETSTSVDLLTSVENRSFTLYNNECEEDQPLPIPPSEPVPGIEEPHPEKPETPPVSTPVTPKPSEPGVSQGSIDHFQKSIKYLIQNIHVVIPLLIVALGTWLSGLLIGNAMLFIRYFLASFLFKRKYWGIVYDNKTLEKLPLTTISIFKVQDGSEILVSQSLADYEGRYNLKAYEPGQYIVRFKREGYKISSRTITIDDSKQVILDVGMLPSKNSKLNFLANLKRFIRIRFGYNNQQFRIVSVVIMLIGTYLALEFFIRQSSVLNLLVLIFYILLLQVQVWSLILEYLQTRIIKVVDEESGSGIKGVIMRFAKKENSEEYSEVSLSAEEGLIKARINNQKHSFLASKQSYGVQTGELKTKSRGDNIVVSLKKIKA